MADDYEVSGGGGFAPVASLATAVSYFDKQFSIKNLVIDEDDRLYVGLAAMVDEEIVVITEVGAGYVKVSRGCSDTIPAPHGVDANIWFYPDNIGLNFKEYSAGESLTIKPLPWLTTGPVLEVDKSPPLDLTMNYRFSRPYPPGYMQSNGTPWFQPVALTSQSPSMVLTWTHRDRVLQEDRQIEHFEGSIGPEPGTTYVARIYDGSNQLRRTEVGIVGVTWTYSWYQAMADLGLSTEPAGSQYAQTYPAYMVFTSQRQGLDGWQAYHLPFSVNNEAPFIQVGQLSEITLQPDADPTSGGTPLPKTSGMFVTGVAHTTLSEEQLSQSGGGEGLPPAGGLFVTAAYGHVTQPTSIYTWMNRALFEAPYTFLLRRTGSVPSSGRVVTVAARPSDRLTDSHKIHSREKAEKDMPQSEFELRDAPAFTPWATIDSTLNYLTNTVEIRTTSLYDGVGLDNVQPGQLAMIGAEIVGVISVNSQTVTLARGCADTIPGIHGAGSRIWFFEAACGLDPTAFNVPPIVRPALECGADPGWVHLQYKMVPDVFGPTLDLNTVPTDTLGIKLRNVRPFPPGQMMVNGKHWFQGVQIDPDRSTVFTWASRNRVTQGVNVVDHSAPSIAHESGTTYRVRIMLVVRPTGSKCNVEILVREEFVTGNRYEYTYEMAYADGTRIARTLSRYQGYNVCGYVSVPIQIDAMRDGKENWQGYKVMMRLPATKCPVGPDGPIGGPGGNTGGEDNGNGDIGGYDPGDGSGGGGGTGPGNGSGGPDGGGPRPPDPLPPDWPDPVGPPPEPDPTEPGEPANPPPDGVGYWDYRWDTFWASQGIDYDPGDGGEVKPGEPEVPTEPEPEE